MNTRNGLRRFSVVFLSLVFASCLTLPLICRAEGPPRITLESTSPQKVRLMVGESKIIEIKEKQGPVDRVELADPKIADTIVLTRLADLFKWKGYRYDHTGITGEEWRSFFSYGYRGLC